MGKKTFTFRLDLFIGPSATKSAIRSQFQSFSTLLKQVASDQVKSASSKSSQVVGSGDWWLRAQNNKRVLAVAFNG